MKKLILFTLLGLVSISTFATSFKQSRTRYYRHELNVSIGSINPSNSGSDSYEKKLMSRFGLVSAGSHDGEFVHECDSKNDPDLGMNSTLMTLGYYYHINERLALGGYLNYVKVGDTLGWYKPHKLNGITMTGLSEVSGSSFFLMPTLKYSWLNNRWCSLYSKAVFGLHYQSLKFESEMIPQELVGNLKNCKNVTLAYSFIPLGWEVGRKRIRWFMELGLGSNTNFKLGLTYRFSRF